MDALDRLIRIAEGDTGGSRRIAQFLLSLWNGDNYTVDLQSLLHVDAEVFQDMVTLWTYLYRNNQQLESLVSREAMDLVLELWGPVFRPDLWPAAHT